MIFHHTGLIVHSIHKFESRFVYEEKIAEVFDELQDAKISLYKNFGDSYIELIEPLSPKSFTWNFINNKNVFPFHHFCYEVSSKNELDEIILKFKLIQILGPIPAILFHGKNVVFCYTRSKMIIEFIITEI